MPVVPVQAPYSQLFVTNGFKPNGKASLEVEFARLAQFMDWHPGSRSYKKHLAKAKAKEEARAKAAPAPTPSNQSQKLNMLYAYNVLAGKSFDYSPTLAFDVEFGRIAKKINMAEGTTTYRKHYEAAKLLDEKIRTLDVSKLKFFKPYAKTKPKFKLNYNSAIDTEFLRLVKNRGWDSKKFRQRWRELIREACVLVNAPIAAPRQVTNATAPSEASGVRLPSSMLSEDQTSTFTPTHSEYTPAPSVSSYFSSFVGSGYTPDPSIGFSEEFDRLSIHEGWTPGDPETIKQWRQALESELVSYFGATDKLVSWQALCTELEIEPPPNSITQCRKALQTRHVSIKDLVESRRELIKQRELHIRDIGVPLPAFVTTSTLAQMSLVPKATVQVFKNIRELSKYCKKKNKLFPKLQAKEDGFLKALLRRLVF